VAGPAARPSPFPEITLPQKSLLAALCAAIALVCASTASAATTSIGVAAANEECGAAGYSWAFADPGTVVPGGGKTITEFRTFSAAADKGKVVSFVVLTPWAQKPAGVTSKVYLVKSQTRYTHEGGDVVRTVSASVPVSPGDVLGLAFTGAQQCAQLGGDADALEGNWFRTPIQTGSLIWNLESVPSYRLNIAASVETPDPVLTLDSAQSAKQAGKWQPAGATTRQAIDAAAALCSKLGNGPVGVEGTCGSSVATARPLEAGKQYVATVSGTVSVWSWNRTMCGAEKVLEDGRRTGIDARFLFASPKTEKCSAQAPLPQTRGSFQISTNGGAKWKTLRDDDARTTPAADHTYRFTITGQGVPARFRLKDSWPQDNAGSFTITVAPKAPSA
jgi:hypothetical protein